MIDAVRAVARFVNDKIGWNRIGIVISITIITVAAVVLYRILRGISFDQVVKALRETPSRDVIVAGFFVAGGYFTLTFYDYFALRTIGRVEIPYRIAVLASFTSYTIGHNLGATVFTGGAVRLRISPWSMSPRFASLLA
jgi:uncharacterized membrane protein YbhN (UPF0104 family)